MSNFLKRINLIDNLSTELEISKHDFVTRLKENVDEGDIDSFSDMFDIFSSSENEYKGHVEFEKFEIKRRAKFFDVTLNMAVAKGTYHQKDQFLIIDTEIVGFPPMMWLFLVVITIFYSIFFLTLIISHIQDNAPLLWSVLFLLFHASFMYGIPYSIMRMGTRRLKYDLEREFHFLAKNKRVSN
jgi:hypothetical protein